MRYSLFDDKESADSFAREVQDVCNIVGLQPRVVKYSVYIENLQKWAVGREIDPPTVRGEDVEDINLPKEVSIE